MFRKIVAALALVAGLGTTLALSFPRVPSDDVWQDQHQGYPVVPNGLDNIRRVFGEACSIDAHVNTTAFVAADDGQPYPVHFHKKLGGADSSNLDNDVQGHITHAHLDGSILSGVYGYNCRLKRGSSSEYSTHAWGIAVDINTSRETPGQPCHSIPYALGSIWTNHRWTWGRAWGDCMHFQYATGY